MKQPQQSNQTKPSQSPASDAKKFLNHFQSINTPMKVPPSFIAQQNRSSSKNKFNTTLQLYASSLSIIDKIADSPIKQSQISYSSAQKNDIVSTPMIVNLNPRIKERIVSINNFFNQDRNEQMEFYNLQQDGNLNAYIQSIIHIDINNTLVRQQEQQNRSRSKSTNKSKGKEQSNAIKTTQRKLSTPPHQPPHQIVHQKQQMQEAQVNTDPILPAQRSPSKLKKMDLLLVEIMREKKRKGFVPDYFRAIQMKLVQMLEYILHDEPDYFGLSLVEKMKEVLKNLESFKGKTIDGESKVNMLRIFFQQFRNLKKQRQQEQQGRQNRSRSHSKKSASKGQSKKSGGPNQVGAPLISRSKKNFDTFSVGGTRSQGKPGPNKNVSTKSVKQEDQWIGSLDN